MKASKIQVKVMENSFSTEVCEAMWQLYQPHYHYSKEAFFARIPKNNFYSLYYQAGQFVGFTGLRIERINKDSKRIFTVYFGQTVIDPSVRSKALIPRTGIKLCQMFWREFLSSRIFFWADALTYKAYLVFAKTLEEYYPNRRQILPKEVRQLRDYLGKKHYGQHYCAISGTVKKDLYLITDRKIQKEPRRSIDPDVRFFHKANPQHESGAGLLTIAPIHAANIWMIVAKVFQKMKLFKKYRPANHQTKYRRLPKTNQINATYRNAG